MHHGLPLGRAPPPRALSAGELSGETTCVDHTDYSDNGLPPHQGLLRDESGSSWWSLEDQGAESGGALPTRCDDQHRGVSVKGYERSGDVGSVGANCGYSGLGQGGGLWSGVHSTSTAGTVSGSGGSAGESWEDDDSEEGLGQAEEEVAALLVGLGKNNEDFEGFSDDDNGENGTDGAGMFSKPPTRHLSVSTPSQEWRV